MSTLTNAEIDEKLARLNADTTHKWIISHDKLHKEFVFSNFINAFSFMTRVAIYAEKADHHPEWFNVYKQVIVDLSTHDANGITDKDFALARAMDKTSGL